MKDIWKKIAIGVGIVALFLALSYGFVPQVLNGKIVDQSDITGYVGMSHEMHEWNKAHPDDPAYWSDSMFGGMPTTAIYPNKKGDATQWIYDLLLVGKRPATYLFVALLGAFLLFLALGVSWPVAIGGAIAIAFCSYNFVIIQAGHNTQMQAIAFMPWVLAALVYTYAQGLLRGRCPLPSPAASGRSLCRATGVLKEWSKVLLGATLFGLALSMQVKANHQQISYYLALIILIFAIVELVHTIRTKAWKPFLIASALLLVLGGAGIATNVNKLLPLAKYTPHTMRGGSELSKGDGKKGLDLEYATAWSYGWEELPNMMIPDFNGGATHGAMDPDKSEFIKCLREAGYPQKELKLYAKALPLYWGPQPYTAGPMYMGAITIFLFILGLGLYKGREKWWLLAATVLAVLMAVGSHFMAFTALCFKVLPLYNKFRTVSMALVILQVTLPVLGFVTLDRITRNSYDPRRFMKAFWWALGLTGGFALLAWMTPTLFGSFTAASEAGVQDVLLDALVQDRIALFRHDALTAVFLIGGSAALLFWAYRPKGVKYRRWIAAISICALSALNLFVVGRRYLNADHFTTPKDFNKPFAERQVDQAILADKDPQYRVLDLSVNVFNSSVPSYHHKNVGGYSPAKLQRYQDLIERYLMGEVNGLYKLTDDHVEMNDVKEWMTTRTPILNALNTRYIILGGNYPPLVNENALGAAWFVDSVVEAKTPEEEIALLGKVDLAREAVVSVIPDLTGDPSEEDHIELLTYTPNELRYHYSASTDRLAVFSEIYYPDGWSATVDGKPVDIFCADWTLRAALLPAGEHDIVMRFAPASYRTGGIISAIASILLLIMLLVAVYTAAAKRRASSAKA
ncbi:MAG: YfhO family protein [Bacteroidales bacterium]|nr:YfhO family protein [Bacteroidales bacterium]